MADSPVLWFSFQDAACCEWRLFLGNERTIPQLEGVEGVTLPDQHLIAIDERLPDDRKLVVAFHEFFHASISQVADPNTLALVFCCTPAEVEAREENIVAFSAPRLFAMLTLAGFLKFPKLPKVRR